MKHLNFISQFAKRPRELGAITQSSRALSRRMAREVRGTERVVELGAGLGPVTREILNYLPAHGQLVCFERNAGFCRNLEQLDDPRLQIIHGDAVNSERYVEEADCVVSGLPLTLFEKNKRRRILRIMSKARKCVQLLYTPKIGLEMRGYFREVKVGLVPWNFPPALVYVATQKELSVVP